MKALIFTIISAMLMSSCQPADDDIYPVNPKAGAYQQTTFYDTTLTQP